MDKTFDCYADRQDDGISVKLWILHTDEGYEASITVNDVKAGEHFVIDPPLDKIMDAFYHPFSYRHAEVA